MSSYDWSLASSSPPPPPGVAPPPPNSSRPGPAPPLWDPPTFTAAAGVRVGATALLFVFSACSNLALLLSLLRGRGRGRGRGLSLRPLMLSLTWADLMMTFVAMPLDAAWNVTVQWRGGAALCRLLSFLKLLALYATAFTLVVISLERQRAVLRPLQALRAQRRNRRMLLAAWSLGLLLAAPQLLIFRTVRLEGADFTQCASHGSFRRRWQESVYNLFQFSALFLLPLLVMSCCYGRILLHIHRRHLRDPGALELRRSGARLVPRARLKTLRMALVIVASFLLCWTPYYLLGLWYWFQPRMVRVTPESVHHALFVFGHLNTCCDPLIYGFYTPAFRADLAACRRRLTGSAAAAAGAGAPPRRRRPDQDQDPGLGASSVTEIPQPTTREQSGNGQSEDRCW